MKPAALLCCTRRAESTNISPPAILRQDVLLGVSQHLGSALRVLHRNVGGSCVRLHEP